MSPENKLAIAEALSRAAFALDTKDLSSLQGGFAHNATFNLDIAGTPEPAVFAGRDAIMDLMRGALETQTDVRKHVISNLFFTAATPTSATVVSYLTLCATESGVSRLITNGVYTDKMLLVEGQWLIRERNLQLDAAY